MPLKRSRESFLFQGLRKLWRMWPPRSEAMRSARVAPATYQCVKCKRDYPFRVGERNLAVDHIEPVIPVTGFTNWDDYINRLFCPVENLQVLCKECHAAKTKVEAGQRAAVRKDSKAKKLPAKLADNGGSK